MEIKEKSGESPRQQKLALHKKQTQSSKSNTKNEILSINASSEILSEHTKTPHDNNTGGSSETKAELPNETCGAEGEQNQRTDKRRRDSEVLPTTRKRRGSFCPQKLNKGDKAALNNSNAAWSLEPSSISSNTNIKVASNLDDKLSIREEKLKQKVQELLSRNTMLENQLELGKSQIEATDKKFLKVQQSYKSCRLKLIEVLRHQAAMERKLREEKLIRDSRQIGRIIQTENSFGAHIDTWENGERFKDLQLKYQKLEKEMEDLAQKRKELSHLKKKSRKRACSSPKLSSVSSAASDEFACPGAIKTVFTKGEMYFGAQAEVYSLQTCHIKRKQAEFDCAKKELALLKRQHIKFLKIMATEKKSAYQGKLLNDRYLCTKLIGRGGFSEVWKAYDLDLHRDVACKIHALNERWSDRKKESFTRHATREAQIQKGLHHPRIVRLYDVFGIDVNTFCTVLELCEGSDFDAYLNANRPLPEREARSIITQLFEGLQYLAQRKQPIIHYDLKPGNLLYSAGEIKITDFGLSKIMQKDQLEMELTSQGAGTYWYLPPECFVTGQEPPMISTGVDMWSGGCILFEMLYGRRPFGHNMTQEKLLREGTVLSAQEIQFPLSPKVSDEAKDLIRKCLARDHRDRPDPLKVLHNHPYFSKLRPARN